MLEPLHAPYLSDEDIRRRAELFLASHHPSRSLPIPIEEIIDLRLKLHITSVPGLLQAFEIDAFTSSDCRLITVDNGIYQHRPARYRFSLAHELGHIELHRQVYSQAQFRRIDEWKAFVAQFPPDEHRWFEFQAYAFAGYVLVPRQELERETEGALRMAAARGMVIRSTDVDLWAYAASYLAETFEVSMEVIQRRWNKEGIRTRRWLSDKGLL